MTCLVGLTGSIGMGKSTAAQMFADAGIPVWDADLAVHRLYAKGGAAVAPVGQLIPGSVENGALSRDVMKTALARDSSLLHHLEAIVHPLVAKDRAAFIARHNDAPILLFDIPLLFETGAEIWLDETICVTAPPEVQRQRVLSRPGMTEAQFDAILARQMPDAEKRRRADHVIEAIDLDETARAVTDLIRKLRTRYA